MSEQPIKKAINIDEYRRTKPDGSLEMGPETDVALHLNQVPDFDTRAVRSGREMFERTQSVIEQPRLSEAALAGIKLAKLNEVRDHYKLIEETEFLRPAA